MLEVQLDLFGGSALPLHAREWIPVRVVHVLVEVMHELEVVITTPCMAYICQKNDDLWIGR